MPDEFWIPLVDEPIGEIVARVEQEHADVRQLVDSPQKLLAFRTFAYIRVGLVLGEALVEADEDAMEEGTWVERLAADPEVWRRVVAVVREVAEEVAEEVAAEASAQAVAPDEGARKRFREAARRALTEE